MKRHVKYALSEVDAILELFAALLRISEVEAGAQRAAFATLDLGALVHGVIETFAPAVLDGGRRLAANVEGVHEMAGDRALLTQLLVNLVENAATHTPIGTSIRVKVARHDDSILLSVADNGQGVRDVEPSSLTRRFVRLEASRSTKGRCPVMFVDFTAAIERSSRLSRFRREGFDLRRLRRGDA